jgi:hypothetical protein
VLRQLTTCPVVARLCNITERTAYVLVSTQHRVHTPGNPHTRTQQKARPAMEDFHGSCSTSLGGPWLDAEDIKVHQKLHKLGPHQQKNGLIYGNT